MGEPRPEALSKLLEHLSSLSLACCHVLLLLVGAKVDLDVVVLVMLRRAYAESVLKKVLIYGCDLLVRV